MHGQWSALHMIWTQPSTFTPRPGQDVEPPQPNHPGAEAWTSGTCGWLGFRHGSPPSACNTTCIFDNIYIYIYIWGFPEIGVPKNGWCIIETPTKIDDLGVHSFMETPIYIYIFILHYQQKWSRFNPNPVPSPMYEVRAQGGAHSTLVRLFLLQCNFLSNLLQQGLRSIKGQAWVSGKTSSKGWLSSTGWLSSITCRFAASFHLAPHLVRYHVADMSQRKGAKPVDLVFRPGNTWRIR